MQDLISRQAAIDALGEKPLAWTESEYEQGLQNQWEQDVDALLALPAAQRWIPVTERLPENGTRNLVTRYDYVTDYQFVDLLWFDKGEWWNRHYTGDYAVTHWMPLPEPPKEEP